MSGNEKIALRAGRNIAIFMGVKFVILYGIARAARKASMNEALRIAQKIKDGVPVTEAELKIFEAAEKKFS